MTTKINISSTTIQLALGFLTLTLTLIGLMFYTLNEPERIENAQAAQLQNELDEAMTLYAENCSVCHGADGTGIGSNPPLNNSILRDADSEALKKIISRGLYNTPMPAWSKEDGGPLSEYQIEQLVKLIQFGDWDEVQNRIVNLGLAPLIPFTADPDPEILAALRNSTDGESLARGIVLYANECVACHGADGLGTTLAPALNDPVIRENSQEEIERIIQNGVPGTLMAPWENTLSIDEISDLSNLIINWDKVPDGAIPATEVNIPVTKESLELGQSLFSSYCSGCHGPEGQGTQRAPSLNVKSFLENTPDNAIQQIITLGVPGTAMPAWGDRMTDVQIQAITGFIRSWEPNAPEVAEPARSRGPWWQTTGDTPSSSQNQISPPQSRGRQGRGNRQSKSPHGKTLTIPNNQSPGINETQGNLGIPVTSNETPSITTTNEVSPNIGIHQPSGSQDINSLNIIDKNTQNEKHSDEGIPPWIEVSEPAPEEMETDSRAWLLIISGILSGMILIAGGLLGLKWFPPGSNN
jgi:mono/diheme cytochrome c family protein